jgi:hypothetical protein
MFIDKINNKGCLKSLLFTFSVASVVLCYSVNTQAVEILCSTPDMVAAKAAEEKPIGFNVVSQGGMSVEDIVDIFSNGTKNIGYDNILICMFPEESEVTQQLYNMLGIKSTVTQSFTSKNSVIDRRVKIVNSYNAMISCVSNTYPSVGYVDSLATANKVLSCM